MFKSWFKQKPKLKLIESVSQASMGAGKIVYAIGDIHGMAHLLDELLRNIFHDRHVFSEEAHLIFLGDMVDRGPESQRVMQTVFELQNWSDSSFVVHVLLGNHEKMMIDFLENPEKSGPLWLRHGGDATLKSYGVHPPQHASEKQLRYLRDELLDRMPSDQVAWLKKLSLQTTIDDFYFCHASIDTRKSLRDQKAEDLLWSRRFPEEDDGPQEKIIVHGHQPVAEPLIAQYHINVDTGAYATGCLSCVKLLGNQLSFLTAGKQSTLQ